MILQTEKQANNNNNKNLGLKLLFSTRKKPPRYLKLDWPRSLNNCSNLSLYSKLGSLIESEDELMRTEYSGEGKKEN